MGSKIEYVDSSQIYATNYVRNSKAVGVLWAIFTICYAIIIVVAFITPEWIGNIEGEVPGKFGLWTVCYAEENGDMCKGRWVPLVSRSRRLEHLNVHNNEILHNFCPTILVNTINKNISLNIEPTFHTTRYFITKSNYYYLKN